MAWKVFQIIEVGLIPIGHTNSENIQTSSLTSRRLRTENSITMEDLYGLFGSCYDKLMSVSALKQVANWSSFFEQSGCLNKIQTSNKFRLFNFVRKSVNAKNGFKDVLICIVRG